MTEERDVLSAEDVKEVRAVRYNISALADSHEALRVCLDEARTLNAAWRGEAESHQAMRLAAEAAAAAAIDALRQIMDELGVPGEDYPAPVANAVATARAAVDAYETAVLGHATPAAADEELREQRATGWDAWFARHPGHTVNGYCLSHPPGCNRRCLDDRPQGHAPWEPAARSEEHA